MATMLRHALVKSVVSGDTIVIKPITKLTKNEADKRISLQYVTAPKLARVPTDFDVDESNFDEPYAFEAREFLRRKLVGKEICYTVDFVIPTSNREMCQVYLGKDKDQSENIIESILYEGLVQLRQKPGTNTDDTVYQRLVTIDQQAKLNKRGRYSDEPNNLHIRDMEWTLHNPEEFVNQHKSSPPLDAIVEFVRNGNTVRCLILPTYNLVTIQLTGIRCPMLKHEENSTSEPFSEEAKQYVETRLLQRQVKIVLDGVNEQNLVATILHPNGNIAIYLLKEGLAKCSDWYLTLLKKDWKESYRGAEKYAKDHRLGIWKNYVPKQNANDNDNNATSAESTYSPLKGYEAHVLEIINGDGLIIRDLRDNQIRRIYLSSVRAPRASDFEDASNNNATSDNQQQTKRSMYDIPFLFDAHELLRKRLIGQIVRVVPDYIQPANNQYPEKNCCTVYIGSVNIGEALILKGLAKAFRHRHNDEERSSCYDALLSAERQAQKRGIGLFSTSTGLHRIVDMSGETNKERTKGLLNVFHRNGRMDGVVEYISSPCRFRIHLTKDNWIISFILSSISCPRPERHVKLNENSKYQRVEPGEPFAEEALSFSKEHFLQRNVFIEIETMDRNNNFMGTLTTADGQSATLMLIQAGLAKLLYSQKKNNYSKELIQAEAACRDQRIGIWTNYEESNSRQQEKEENENEEKDNVNEENVIDFEHRSYRRVVVTHMTIDLKVYVQYCNQGHAVEQLQTSLNEALKQIKSAGEYKPKKGELLAVRFSADNQWYRGRVEKIEGNSRLFVYYIDYGNREILTDFTQITMLPDSFSQTPPFAHEFEFAFVRIPHDDDAQQDAKDALANIIGDSTCLIKIEYRRNNIPYISIYDADTKENLIKRIVEQGYIGIDDGHDNRAQRSKILYEHLKQAEKFAKSERIRLWQYSDQIEDDATEFGFTGRKK